ncbi:MAG: hypothetical protein ABI276_00485 [Acidimicrobiales bacterium]
MRDLAGAGALLADDIEWSEPAGEGPPDVYRGRYDVLELLARQVNESGGTYLARPLATFDGADGRVIVLQEESNSSAAEPSVETTCVLVVADGDRLLRVARFVSPETVTHKVP